MDHTLTKKKSVTIQPKNRQMRHFFEEICSNRNFKFQLNRKNGLEVIGKFVIFLIHFTPVDGNFFVFIVKKGFSFRFCKVCIFLSLTHNKKIQKATETNFFVDLHTFTCDYIDLYGNSGPYTHFPRVTG